MSKSISIQFIIPEEMDTEDIINALHSGLESIKLTRKDYSETFQVEIDDVLLRDRLVIIKEMK